MKNLFPEDKSKKEKIMDFFNSKGFYVTLIVCLCIAAAAAIFMSTRDLISPKDGFEYPEEIVSEGEKFDEFSYIDETEDAPTVESSVNSSPPIQTKIDEMDESLKLAEGEKSKESEKKNAKPVDEKQTDKNTKEAAPKESAPQNTAPKKESTAPTSLFAKDQKFTMPVLGEITFDYASDKLIYSKTLEEWRTHSGVDIAAQRGTAVKAVADGVVSEIKNDPRFGVTVVIDHENGLKTIYSNLASGDGVSPNQKVKQGDAIGSVGNTAVFESAEEDHLHFEVLKEDKLINPNEYLPAKTN